MAVQIRIHGTDRRPYRASVDEVLEIGREDADLVVADPAVSRRHARLEATPDGLAVTDLDSSNGTKVNGVRITGTARLSPGDVVVVGTTEIHVLTDEDAGDGAATPDAVTSLPGVADLADMARMEDEAAVVRFRPGSAGEEAAPGVLAAVKRSRRRLAGLGSESWGRRPQVCLVDPFPDPADATTLVTAGTVLDAPRDEIWMVVTPEAPADPPGRALALLFGATLPAADELTLLLEGYGLWVDDTTGIDDGIRHRDLPPLASAEGELRPAMALSFVRFLIGRESEDGLRRLLGAARPGRVDDTAREVYGAGLGELELTWREVLTKEAPTSRPIEFLRLSVRYLRPHLGRQIEIFVYMALALGFTTAFPFITRDIFDTALPSGQFSRVLEPLGLLGGALLISLVAGLRRAYVTASVSQAVVRDLRLEMFGRLQSLPTGWFARHPQGDVMARMFGDVGQVETGISRTLTDGVFHILSLIVSSVVMLRLNLWLGLLVLAGSPVVALVYRKMRAGARQRSLTVQEESGRLMGVASENIEAQPVVKIFGLHAREQDRFERTSQRVYRAEKRLSLFSGLFGLSVNTVVTVLRLTVLGLGAWMILEGHFTIGGLVAFLGTMGEVLSPVTILTGLGQELQAATGSLVRINEILDAAPEVVDEPGAPVLAPLDREIRFDAVSFSYVQERRTLRELDAVIVAGSRVAFVGPSGSGKSTVLRLLMRLHDPDEGTISIDGHDIGQVRLDSLRGQVGVVFQDTFLFNTTVRENIALGRPGASDAEVEAAARMAEVDAFVADLPRGYDTPVGERGAQLSGGQRQRVAIARALIRNPRLLLLDEATSALDPRTERQIVTTLEKVSSGRTTVAITHRLTSVVDYDQIFVLVDGEIVERGTHKELVAAAGAYARLWAEQTGEAGVLDRGRRKATLGPTTGRMLPRLTLSGTSTSQAPAAADAVDGDGRRLATEVRRASGAFPSMSSD